MDVRLPTKSLAVAFAIYEFLNSFEAEEVVLADRRLHFLFRMWKRLCFPPWRVSVLLRVNRGGRNSEALYGVTSLSRPNLLS